MRTLRKLRNPMLAGAAWSLLALASFALRDGLGGVVLLWVPSGVAAAAFLAARPQVWARLSLVLLPIETATLILVGVPMATALVYAVAGLVQSIIAASLSLMALDGRKMAPVRFRQVAGLFTAALLGSLAGALLAFPFRPEQSLAELAWWFLANVLAILTVTPILLLLLARGRLIGERLRQFDFKFERALLSFLIACATLYLAVLQVDLHVLMSVLMAAIVLATVRFGQMAALLVVLIYAAIATSLSVVAGSPLPSLDVPAGHAALIVQGWLFAMLATVLPIAAMLLKRHELQRELVRSNAQMRQSLALFNLAEETAGIGRWRLDLVTGEQDWSPQMLEMNGLSRSLAPDPGDVRQRLPDGGDELFSIIARNRDNRDTYSFMLTVRPNYELERILSMAMRNEFDASGRRVAVFAVAVDVTKQVRREQALEAARGHAVRMAAEAQKLANTDPLTGLPNRRCTFDRLDSMLVMAENNEAPLSAILFDIDHFKLVNDTFGHQVGDAVLVEVAALARVQTRPGDLVGRIGGEEFAWLLSGVSPQTVLRLAERLRRAVEGGREGSRLPRVTISVGIAHMDAGDGAQSLLARADAALYAAKDAGRNRVQKAA